MWWDNLTVFQQVTFVIGSVTALFMVLQIVLMLVGLGGDDTFESGGGFDGDSDIFNNEGIMSGLKLISLRSIIAFVCVGSWVTYTMIFVWPNHQWAAFLVGIAAGAAVGVLVAFAIQGFMKLQAEGNVIIENCIGKIAEVYLTIPPDRSGHGKVNVYVQEAVREYDVVTDSDTPLKTGSQVKIIAVVSQGVLLAEPFFKK